MLWHCIAYTSCTRTHKNGLYFILRFPKFVIFALSKDETFGLCEERHEKTCFKRTCQNKDADQLRSNRANKQCLRFRYGIFSTDSYT